MHADADAFVSLSGKDSLLWTLQSARYAGTDRACSQQTT